MVGKRKIICDYSQTAHYRFFIYELENGQWLLRTL